MSELRSSEWFAGRDRDGVIHRSGLLMQGLPRDVSEGRPVIGIANSWSELTPCNSHLRTIAEAVKRGIWESGGLPLEFPTISLGEQMIRPTAMFLRNLMSMDVEEVLRANPLDGVVLLAGCDKTTPAQLMGAASVDLPTMMITGGSQLTAHCNGEELGSGTDLWRKSEQARAGEISSEDFLGLESCAVRSVGHCNSMGTASTMACLAEALGVQLPGAATFPAADSRRQSLAQMTGRRIVELVREGVTLSQILTRDAFENAVRVLAAIGGSTNAVIHLIAIAGRIGVPLDLDDIDKVAREVPTLVNLKPSGKFLMEDFAYAGGIPAVLWELRSLLHTDAITVSGRTVGENARGQETTDRRVVLPFGAPLLPAGSGTAVLTGNLCPSGAVIKQSAATPALLVHRGPALVFDSIQAYNAVRDDPELPVDEDTVLVVRNVGPRGYPGMPEVGNLQLPRVLLERGIYDVVRVSDARMSGTAYGTVVLHVAPEAAAGGPLALVESGDWIELDVPARTLRVDLPDEELERRRSRASRPPASPARGYSKLFADHVLQADRGVDFDFLVGSSGHDVPPESH
ncbi:MAG: dihydroxy-acid dehydratase [Acidimicrobiaceae bacterium]|jgi:dihydroxy-acid dehydratase|nr:dihydroxy-acid dehydratase [Acidimicrobiaceae bacterium]